MGWRSNKQVSIFLYLCPPFSLIPKLINHFSTSALLPSAPLLGVVYLFNLKCLQSPGKPGGTELPSLSMIHITSPQSFPGKENEKTLLTNSLFPHVSYKHILLCILMYHMPYGHKTWLAPFVKAPGLNDRRNVKILHFSLLSYWLSYNLK